MVDGLAPVGRLPRRVESPYIKLLNLQHAAKVPATKDGVVDALVTWNEDGSRSREVFLCVLPRKPVDIPEQPGRDWADR
jgi:hypothetical protein